jgi:hypothetical protein
MRKVLCGLWLCALLFTSCGTYTPPSPLPIQSVTPVASLPALPEREAKTLRTYAEALNYAQDLKTTIEELGGQIDILIALRICENQAGGRACQEEGICSKFSVSNVARASRC